MEKKRILIYGDSNTHGFRVSDGLRFGPHQRWTGICQDLMADRAEILNEGLNGRMTCFDEEGMAFRNGLTYIEPCIRTHLPLDMVCVMLGSNDLKLPGQTAETIAAGAARVLDKARQVNLSKYPENTCRYVLIAPIVVSGRLADGPFGWEFCDDAPEISKGFRQAFDEEARRCGFLYFDASAHAQPGTADGLHLDEENHRRLGEAFAAWLAQWL